MNSEVLTTKDSSVATVWLLSTLGTRFSHRKITKKEIQSISIPHTCDVIGHPPRPIALRLTSNLLYGVTLVYKQKTDYLNNDTVVIKTRIQRDLFNKNNDSNKLLLSLPETLFNDPIYTSVTRGGNAKVGHGHQILLKDDPSFRIDSCLLPTTSGLEFLNDTVIANKDHDILERKDEIRRSDITNNTISMLHSVRANTDDAAEGFSRFSNNFDELEQMNPEFAFNEDGMLLELNNDDTTLVKDGKGSQVRDDLNDGFDIDFDFDFEFDNISNNNIAPQNSAPKSSQLEEILQGPSEASAKADDILASPKNAQRKKRTRPDFSDIVIDESISLQTNDLRDFRDNYVAKMSITKRPKRDGLKSLLTDILTENSFTHLNTTDLLYRKNSYFANTTYGNETEGDFVDSLLRHRRSSESIEVRRNASSTRRNSRSSISVLNLPIDEANNTVNESNQEYGDFFDVDFGDALVTRDSDSSNEERSGKKRSSSSVHRFETVQEDLEMDFDFNIDEDNDKVLIDDGMTNMEPHIHEEENGRKTKKFFSYIKERVFEENTDSISFGELLDNSTNRSVVVKSFYELLQLATLKHISLEVSQPYVDTMRMIDPNELTVKVIM